MCPSLCRIRTLVNTLIPILQIGDNAATDSVLAEHCQIKSIWTFLLVLGSLPVTKKSFMEQRARSCKMLNAIWESEGAEGILHLAQPGPNVLSFWSNTLLKNRWSQSRKIKGSAVRGLGLVKLTALLGPKK